MGKKTELGFIQRRFIEYALGELVPEFELCASEAVDLLAEENRPLPGPRGAEPGFDTIVLDSDFWNWALQVYSLLFSIAAYYVGRTEASRDQVTLRDEVQAVAKRQERVADETRNALSEIATQIANLKNVLATRGVEAATEDLTAVLAQAREASEQTAKDLEPKIIGKSASEIADKPSSKE